MVQLRATWSCHYAKDTGMQILLIRHNDNILLFNFNKPRECKINDFSYLESLKNHKRGLHWGTFFECTLVGSKKR
jgi:hypothetical protein